MLSGSSAMGVAFCLIHAIISVLRALVLSCLGSWSKAGFVHDNDVKAVAALPDVVGEDSQVLENEQ